MSPQTTVFNKLVLTLQRKPRAHESIELWGGGRRDHRCPGLGRAQVHQLEEPWVRLHREGSCFECTFASAKGLASATCCQGKWVRRLPEQAGPGCALGPCHPKKSSRKKCLFLSFSPIC